MSEIAKKIATFEDWMMLPEETRAELIDGEIVKKASPSAEHSFAQVGVLDCLRPFRSGGGRSSGWWILTEASIKYEKSAQGLIADVAGWKKCNYPEAPKGYPITILPDFVCEICVTTWKKDTTIVFKTLETDGVPYYWLLDVERKNLIVYELVNGRYTIAHNFFPENGPQRIEPFTEIETDVASLFGVEPSQTT